MNDKKFDSKKLQKLNDPLRLIDVPPEFVSNKLSQQEPDMLIEIGAGRAFATRY